MEMLELVILLRLREGGVLLLAGLFSTKRGKDVAVSRIIFHKKMLLLAGLFSTKKDVAVSRG